MNEFEGMTENEAREQIKTLVGSYYHTFKEQKESFKPGDRISRPFKYEEQRWLYFRSEDNLNRSKVI